MLFVKYHSCGNDFIMLDNYNKTNEILDKNLAKKMCHRRFGIGADGIIAVSKVNNKLEMVYYNADGKIGSFCGNGSRAFVSYCYDLGLVELNKKINFIASDGIHTGQITNYDKKSDTKKVSILMSEVDKIEKYKKDYVLDTGSPHYVIFCNDINKVDVIKEGKKIRYNNRFKKEGINVNFVEIFKENNLKIRTYERGVEAETYACGTGCVAAALAANFYGLNFNCFNLETKGGLIEVSFKKAEGEYKNIYLKGNSIKSFEGRFMV